MTTAGLMGRCRGRPNGTTAIEGERFRRLYSVAYSEHLTNYGREPSDVWLARALGVHPRTLHRYRERFGLPRGSTG